MIFHIAGPRTTLRKHSGISREGRAVPRCVGKVEITTFAGAVPVSRKHFAWVEVGVTFSPNGVDAAFKENKLANEHKGKDDMDEDGGRHPTGEAASVGHLEDLLGGDNPDANETAKEEDLGEEYEECDHADSAEEGFVLE